MKRFYTLCVVLLVLSSLLLSAYAQANGVGNEPLDPATWMPDANLRNAVRAALRLNANEPLTQQKLLNLTRLKAQNLGITDLTGLEYTMNLRWLAVGGNRIRDLTPLANLTGLRALYIGGNAISDINPLAHLTNLRRLGLDRNQVTDITVLAGLVNLTYLRLAGNPITNPCPLESLPNLRDVDIEIPSLIPDANLRTAVRMALGIEASACITIEAMRDLTTLSAIRLKITDLTGLEYATNLTHLYIGGNLISDIAPLAGLTNLRVLSVGGNQISDLTPLSNLRRLTELSIANNMVSDISPLRNVRSLKRLEARRNSISDISVLADLVNLVYLRLRGNPIRDLSPLRSLPKLTDVDVHVLSPPQEKNIRTRGEPTPIIDPPQGDSGQSPQQPKYARSANVNQPATTPQPQQHQQPDANRGFQTPQQHQQPNQNSGPQVLNDPPDQNSGAEPRSDLPDQNRVPPPPQSEVYTPQNDKLQTEPATEIDLSDKKIGKHVSDDLAVKLLAVHESGETSPSGSRLRCGPPIVEIESPGRPTLINQNGEIVVEGKLPEGISVEFECTGRAPSHPKNAFLLDPITLEQLDPAALEAQLDTWRAESDGSTLYLRSIALLESVLATRRPDKTHLLPNYPNPFNPETWIPYHLANPSQVQITIYDTRGTVVRHLDLGHQQAGYYTSRSRAVYWDGCNDIGEKVSSGIYFYQLQTDRTSLLRKMLILK